MHRALDTTFLPGPAVAFHGWGEVGEEVSSLFLFFVSFWSFLLFFQTLVITLAVWTTPAFSCTEAVTAQPSYLLSVRGQNIVGAGLGAGTLRWLGFLQRLCADSQSALGLQLYRKLI